MVNLVKNMTTAGITIFVAYVASVVLLSTAPSDSGQRGAGHGAVGAAALLEIIWVVLGAIVAITRWRTTTITFRAVLTLNVLVVCFLIAAIFR